MASNTLQGFLDEIIDLPNFVGFGDKVVEVHTRGLLGVTPLHIAAIRGDVHIIGLLLDAGADIDARGEYGHTPLQDAVGQGHVEAVRLLLQRGASKSIRNDWGQNAGEIAQTKGKHELDVLFSDDA